MQGLKWENPEGLLIDSLLPLSRISLLMLSGHVLPILGGTNQRTMSKSPASARLILLFMSLSLTKYFSWLPSLFSYFNSRHQELVKCGDFAWTDIHGRRGFRLQYTTGGEEVPSIRKVKTYGKSFLVHICFVQLYSLGYRGEYELYQS